MQTNYTIQQIRDTYNRIKSHIHKTPVLTSTLINNMAGCELFFKCENFQKAGSFKIRGATNAILQLSKTQQNKGVITHSSGNFAQALALAARTIDIPAYIVMPQNAPTVKVEAVKAYGAQIRFCENTQQKRESTTEKWQKETGATFLHPYNNPDVILGQSTCAYELYEQIANLQTIITPVGGGGLVSGTALATNYISPYSKIYAAEPSGADDAWHSLKYGKIFPSENPNTIADGLLTSLGTYTFPIIKKYVSEIITVNDAEIINAMQLVWSRMKIITEASSATTLAAVLKNNSQFSNQRVGLILSGGNVDLKHLPF